MKKALIFCILLAIAGTAVPATAGDFVMDTRTSVRFYGGIGFYGPTVYKFESSPEEGTNMSMPRLNTAIYGFSVQRDLFPRIALELDVQNSYRNTFPTTLNYFQDDRIAEYIDRWIDDGRNPNGIDLARYNSVAVTLRPVFHIINTPVHRFSVYAGAGFYVSDYTGLRVDYPVLFEPDYTLDYNQYHIFGLAGAAGVRYEFTFAEHYMVGADLGAAFNDNRRTWDEVNTRLNWYDVRALFYVGFRF